jgi:hypothetical protein
MLLCNGLLHVRVWWVGHSYVFDPMNFAEVEECDPPRECLGRAQTERHFTRSFYKNCGHLNRLTNRQKRPSTRSSFTIDGRHNIYTTRHGLKRVPSDDKLPTSRCTANPIPAPFADCSSLPTMGEAGQLPK